ncbi:MAG: hypothetical protein Q9227_001413 [Pyrenula ochraceoflavens]
MTSAKSLGDRLLSDVQEESFDETSQTSVFGIDAIDGLLGLFCSPPALPENRPRWSSPGSQLISTELSPGYDRYESDQEEAFDHGILTRNFNQRLRASKPAIVSLTTPPSHAHLMGPRTALLYYLTSIAILPSSVNGVTVDGKEATVVYLDTDERFSATHMAQVLEGITFNACKSQQKPMPLPEDMRQIVASSMQHVHVHRIQSSAQLIATLRALPHYLLNRQNHRSFDRALSLLVLDSADAFHWQDRAEAEEARLERLNPTEERTPFAGRARAPIQTVNKAAETIRLLRQIQKTFSNAVIYTKSPATSTIPLSNQMSAISTPSRQPNNDPWHSFSTLPLQIEPSYEVPQFAPMMSLEQCLEDREKRQTAVEGVKYIVGVEWSRGDDWGPALRAQIKERERRGEGNVVLGFGKRGRVMIE